MNIHLLLTDIWFYTTLLLGSGYVIQVVLVVLLLRKVPMLKSIKATRKYKVSIDTVPVPAVVDPVFEGIIHRSTLRQRLQNDTGNN